MKETLKEVMFEIMANGSSFPAQEKGVTSYEKGTSHAPFKLNDFTHILLSQRQPIVNIWEFKIIAGITKATALHYGGLVQARKLILAQLGMVNHRFNQPVFKQPIFLT